MGCDIHLHIEVKCGGEWMHYGAPYVPRCYRLFALMADVRNNEESPLPCVSKPKGLPGNMSYLTAQSAAYWGADGHSHSWLSADELIKLEDLWEKIKPDQWEGSDLEHHVFSCYLEGGSWAGFARYPQERKAWIEDVRFVFWFDN